MTIKRGRKATKPMASNTATAPTTTESHNSEKFLKDRRWARVFLPTLTHALYISREPFKHFTVDSPKFLATVQHVFNRAFPDVSLNLSTNDKLTTTVSLIID